MPSVIAIILKLTQVHKRQVYLRILNPHRSNSCKSTSVRRRPTNSGDPRACDIDAHSRDASTASRLSTNPLTFDLALTRKEDQGPGSWMTCSLSHPFVDHSGCEWFCLYDLSPFGGDATRDPERRQRLACLAFCRAAIQETPIHALLEASLSLVND